MSIHYTERLAEAGIEPSVGSAQVPGIDRARFEELARTAEKNCPVSKVLNAEITMRFELG